jgi:putative FmdB family regulatory protein
MPTYDYECRACGKTFEVFQSIAEAPKKKCPACGKAKLQRLIGPGAGFIFKGSGFYITDYRSADYKEKAKAESGATAKTDAKGGDAKPGDAKTSTPKEGTGKEGPGKKDDPGQKGKRAKSLSRA